MRSLLVFIKYVKNSQVYKKDLTIYTIKKGERFMTVNHGGALGKDYFLSYLNLIKLSRNCNTEQAKNITMELFFHNNIDQYGRETYNRFLDAYFDLKNQES